MQRKKTEDVSYKLAFGRTAILIRAVIYWLEQVFIPGTLSLKYGDQTGRDAFYDTIIICGLEKLLSAKTRYLTDFL